MDVTQRLREVLARMPSDGTAVLEHLTWDRADPRGWPRWLLGVLLVAVPSHALGLWRVVEPLGPGLRPPMLDSLIFEYVGWYLTVGGRLYLDAWELKPPLPYETAAVLSLLAGGDPVVHHWLAVLVTITVAVATAVVAGALVHDLTADDFAAFAAGASLYVLPAFHWRAAYGFKAKYVVPLGALLAIYLARRDHPTSAGVAAGVAVGFWQLAVVVPALAAGVAYDRGDRSAVVRLVAGAAGVFTLSLLPVLYWGALEAMITEVLLVPLLVGEGRSAAAQLGLAGQLFGGSLSVVAFGVLGVAAAAARRPRETWWLAAGATWFGLQVLLVDLDGAPDLFPLMAFLAVGIGVLLGLEAGPQRTAAALLAILAAVSVVTMGGFGLGTAMLHEPAPLVYEPDRELSLPYSAADRQHLFWNQQRPETCRVFFGPTQDELVERTGGAYAQETCGDAGPVLDALAEKYGFG